MKKMIYILMFVIYSVGIYALTQLILGHDPALHLAQQLHLGNGFILAAILGGLTGLRLILGGPKRLSTFAGFVLGVFVGWLVWQWAGSYSWAISMLLTSAFGEGAEVFASLVALMLLFGMMRAVADLGTGWVKRLLVWSAKKRRVQVGMKEASQPS